MQTYIRRTLGATLLGLGVLSTGCDRFVTVKNPSNLETDAIDPDRDASLLSSSTYTRFVQNLEYAYILGAWFTNHARVGDTFPTRNAVGQRNIPDAGNETDAIWNNIGINLQFARTTIKSTAAAGPTLNSGRAWWVSGFSILQMADYFCEGTIAAGTGTEDTRPKMSSAALYDSAIVDLTQARTILTGLTGLSTADQTEANNLANSALVGIARAQLQLGRAATAATTAQSVPANFTYNILHIDNSSQRSLGNQIWSFSESRISLVTGPEFRAIATGNDVTDGGKTYTGTGRADSRIAFTDAGRLAQDGVLQFYRQAKMPGWASNMRFASKLEAQYIDEEARKDPVTMLTFINARRTAGGQLAYAGATDVNSLMAELLLQKSIDFWLEGKDMADFRRNPTIYPFVLPTGNNYYKASLGPVGTDACWPVPRTEKERNLNWNK
jgi:starch-binding outer membrane protein, SusD/RagB family